MVRGYRVQSLIDYGIAIRVGPTLMHSTLHTPFWGEYVVPRIREGWMDTMSMLCSLAIDHASLSADTCKAGAVKQI